MLNKEKYLISKIQLLMTIMMQEYGINEEVEEAVSEKMLELIKKL